MACADDTQAGPELMIPRQAPGLRTPPGPRQDTHAPQCCWAPWTRRRPGTCAVSAGTPRCAQRRRPSGLSWTPAAALTDLGWGLPTSGCPEPTTCSSGHTSDAPSTLSSPQECGQQGDMQSPPPPPQLVSPGHGLLKVGIQMSPPRRQGLLTHDTLCSYGDDGCRVQGLRSLTTSSPSPPS